MESQEYGQESKDSFEELEMLAEMSELLKKDFVNLAEGSAPEVPTEPVYWKAFKVSK